MQTQNSTEPVLVTTYRCCPCTLKDLDPRTWGTDRAKKAVEVSISVFAVALIALIVACLIARYPTASGIFTTVFAVVTAVALVSFIISCIKYCKAKPDMLPTRYQPYVDSANAAIDSAATRISVVTTEVSETIEKADLHPFSPHSSVNLSGNPFDTQVAQQQ